MALCNEAPFRILHTRDLNQRPHDPKSGALTATSVSSYDLDIGGVCSQHTISSQILIKLVYNEEEEACFSSNNLFTMFNI